MATNNIINLNRVNAQTGTTYTVQLSDFGKVITLNNASAITVTLPQTSNIATGAGFFCWLNNIGAGQVTIVKEGAETLSGNTLLNQGAECKIDRLSTTAWAVFGGTATINTEYTIPIIKAATASDVAYFTIYAAYNGTILSCSQQADSFGTAGDYTVSIDGVNVTGLTTVTNTTSKTTTAATAANTFLVGSVIKLTLGGTVATGVNYAATLNCTRTL